VNRPFISKPENFAVNVQDGLDINAFAALLTAPEGSVPGIIVRSGPRIRFIIPAHDAIRLANEIADAVEAAEGYAA
jgi:hypothetical protein